MKRRTVKDSVEMKRVLNQTYLNYAKKRRDDFTTFGMRLDDEAQILGFIKGVEYCLSDNEVPEYIKKFVNNFA